MSSSARQREVLRGYCRRSSSHDLDASVNWHRRVVEQVAIGVSAIAGREAARTIEAEGVEQLHRVIDACDVGQLREHVVEALRDAILHLTVRVGRAVLGWHDEFYVDDCLILRVNFPYDVARSSDPAAEDPGIGRVSPAVRQIARERRVHDPLFDPKSYHRNHPPAAWAQGPHRDSWSGQSKNGINVWWAISTVPANAGLVLYPELDDVDLPSDPRSGFLRPGYPLPKPTCTPLAAGEMLVFDPETLHGTHLNVTGNTRVALSMRLDAGRPRFDPRCAYAHEFWRRATAIEAGAFGEILHLKREDNLAPEPAPLPVGPTPRRPPLLPAVEPRAHEPVVVGPSRLLRDGERAVVKLPNQDVVIGRTHGALWAFPSACPHYGVDLADGATDGTDIYCPGCGVAFALKSGCCEASTLVLRPLQACEDGGIILLKDW